MTKTWQGYRDAKVRGLENEIARNRNSSNSKLDASGI